MSAYLERIVRFVAVVDCGSMTKAAAMLNIDQPALSKQIRQLENELGFALFERQKSRLNLTAEGTALLNAARELSDAATTLRSSIRQIGRGMHSLRLGVSALSYWVPVRDEIIEAFRERHRTIELKIVSARIQEMLAQLRNGDLDAAIISQPPEDGSTYYYLPL